MNKSIETLDAEYVSNAEVYLGNAMRALYIRLPGGEKNYGEEPQIGHVSISRKYPKISEKMVIRLIAGKPLQELMWNPAGRVVELDLAEIDMSDNTYSCRWHEGHVKDELLHRNMPLQLMEDTDIVMGLMGLKKSSDAEVE